MQDFNYIMTALDQRASGTITVTDYSLLSLDAATGTITVDDYALLVEANATGTITIVDYSAISGVTITVDAVDYVEGVDFTAETSNDVTATNLATAIDADSQGAAAVGAVVTVTAATAGSAGNAIDMATDDAVNITLSGATLTGGQDHATITVDSVALVQGTDFTAETSNDVTATNIAAAIDAGAQGATATTNVVTVTAATAGAAGNAIGMVYVGTTGGVTLSAATLLGGQDAGTFTVNAVTKTEGSDFNAETSNDVTATNIATAINAISGVNASATGSVVTIYADAAGTAGNAMNLLTNVAAATELSGATLLGGVAETITDVFDYSGEDNVENVEALLNVTALAGSSPTADVTPQYSYDKVTFFDHTTAFTQATGVTHEVLDLTQTAVYMRFKIVLGGTTGGILTGKITAVAK